MRAVNTAPSGVLDTEISPPCRSQTSLVRASPMPRSPSRAAFVVKPWENTSWASSGATPGPESRTTISTLEASWRSATSTQASSSWAAASTALSTRLPTTVATSAASSGDSRSSAVSSEIRRLTLRSAARDAFAISRAATAVSRTRRLRVTSRDWRRWFRARM
ncbi:hypothetical protein SUDANB51_07212 [Streptomyces sp. enrichment culture]